MDECIAVNYHDPEEVVASKPKALLLALNFSCFIDTYLTDDMPSVPNRGISTGVISLRSEGNVLQIDRCIEVSIYRVPTTITFKCPDLQRHFLFMSTSATGLRRWIPAIYQFDVRFVRQI